MPGPSTLLIDPTSFWTGHLAGASLPRSHVKATNGTPNNTARRTAPRNASDLLWRSEWFVSAVSSLVVPGITVESYRRRPRRSILLIAIGSATASSYGVLSWMAETTSPVFWGLMSLVNIGAGVFWLVGVYLLLSEIGRIDGTRAEPGAPPNAGPAVPVDNPNGPGGPPSVS